MYLNNCNTKNTKQEQLIALVANKVKNLLKPEFDNGSNGGTRISQWNKTTLSGHSVKAITLIPGKMPFT